MNAKTLFSLIAIFLVSLLTGCASVVPMPTQEGSMPPQMKSVEYYKTHLPEVIKKAEATGDAATQVELAYVYGNTWYNVVDLDKHKFWLDKAAAQNNLPAVCALGVQFYAGRSRKKDFILADSLVSKAYSIYMSKPKSEWSTYDINQMSGALLKRGEVAKTKDLAKQDLCLAKSLSPTSELYIYSINKQIRERNIKCD